MVRNMKNSYFLLISVLLLILPLRVWAFRCNQTEVIASVKLAMATIGLAEQASADLTVTLWEFPPVPNEPREEAYHTFAICFENAKGDYFCAYPTYEGWTP